MWAWRAGLLRAPLPDTCRRGPAVARESWRRVAAVSGAPVRGDQAGSFVEVTGCSGAGVGQAPDVAIHTLIVLTHALTHSHSYRSTHSYTPIHTHILIHSPVHTHTHANPYVHPLTQPTCSHTCTSTHTHMHTLIHSLTGTHAQAPAANRTLHGGPPCPGQAAWTQVRIAATPSPHWPNAKLHLT